MDAGPIRSVGNQSPFRWVGAPAVYPSRCIGLGPFRPMRKVLRQEHITSASSFSRGPLVQLSIKPRVVLRTSLPHPPWRHRVPRYSRTLLASHVSSASAPRRPAADGSGAISISEFCAFVSDDKELRPPRDLQREAGLSLIWMAAQDRGGYLGRHSGCNEMVRPCMISYPGRK